MTPLARLPSLRVRKTKSPKPDEGELFPTTKSGTPSPLKSAEAILIAPPVLLDPESTTMFASRAARNVPSPEPSAKTTDDWLSERTTSRSPSPLKSASTALVDGDPPIAYSAVGGRNVPSPFPRKTDKSDSAALVTIRSALPSQFTSASASAIGSLPLQMEAPSWTNFRPPWLRKTLTVFQ